MKKFGFTLAEVLITLAIIGVIAAITLPTLMTDTTSAQVGPKLAKAVAMFEQANEALLNENSVDTISDIDFNTVADYETQLARHLKGSVNENTFLSKDGMSYTFTVTNRYPANTGDPAHMQRLGNVMIDINGPNTRPNVAGVDLFYFSVWNDGSLRPKGGANWGGADTWQVKCKVDEVPLDYSFCAGHVFENNFKVLYR